jgi:general secretion pathway protein G
VNPETLSCIKPGAARPRSTRSGFTLLELLVVLVILGLLTSYVGLRYFEHIGKSEVKVARAQIEELDKALEIFRLDSGRYPTAEEGLTALVQRPGNAPRWAGPYIKKGVPPDPWGRPYQYRQPGEHGTDYDLYSFGKDGQPGGVGEAQDITNWSRESPRP